MDNKQTGKLFSFYPVTINDNDEGCKEIEGAWQWKYFGWAFHIFGYTNYICCIILGVEPNFPVKLDKK